MKKLLSFIFIIFSIFVCSISNAGVITFFNLDGVQKVILYCDEDNNFKNTTCYQNGDGFVYEMNDDVVLENFESVKGLFGVTIIFENCELQKILDNVNVVNTEKIDDLEIYYATAKNIMLSSVINDKKINLQIAVSGEKIVVGMPLILGSY